MPQVKRKLKKVAVLVETTRSYARGLVTGISRYAREQGDWALYFTPRGLDDPVPHWLKDWSGDGILARIENEKMLQEVRACKVPVVDFRRVVEVGNIPVIGPNDQLVSRNVYEHFRQRGFRHIGYYGMPDSAAGAMKRRAQYLAAECENDDIPLLRFRSRTRRRYHTASSWEREHDTLAQWLSELPKPVGVMACTDDYGVRLLDAARRADVAVPEEVAVVAVGNDECLCQLATPSLSSVALNSEHIGYEGAKVLDGLMRGKSRKQNKQIHIDPAGVVPRLSSDILAVSDPRAASAIRFIREHAFREIGVTDVMKHVHMSRTGLNTLLRNAINRSVHEEIRRVRLERVRELLITTDAPIKEIAYKTGFHYPEYLVRAFKNTTGKTPREFRQEARAPG
ncbi:DNA-binding transcriptional regulator [Aeoliella sp.]|uniref:DNA-binding transcriptional regulator n=1 Tax=Aeoliella sp. TaxID=2795800 RepID=UPI003CCBC852